MRPQHNASKFKNQKSFIIVILRAKLHNNGGTYNAHNIEG